MQGWHQPALMHITAPLASRQQLKQPGDADAAAEQASNLQTGSFLIEKPSSLTPSRRHPQLSAVSSLTNGLVQAHHVRVAHNSCGQLTQQGMAGP